jgi:hypothetical protein
MSSESSSRERDEYLRLAEREHARGNHVSGILYANEGWMLENGNWLEWIKEENHNGR